jgi:hypothetical protein
MNHFGNLTFEQGFPCNYNITIFAGISFIGKPSIRLSVRFKETSNFKCFRFSRFFILLLFKARNSSLTHVSRPSILEMLFYLSYLKKKKGFYMLKVYDL